MRIDNEQRWPHEASKTEAGRSAIETVCAELGLRVDWAARAWGLPQDAAWYSDPFRILWILRLEESGEMAAMWIL